MSGVLTKPEDVIRKEDYFSLSFVLSRVLNSGVIMSIEKNDHELKGLEKSIAKLTGLKHVSLFNSFTGAVHGALWGQDLGYGSSARLDHPSDQESKFIHWLGLITSSDPNLNPDYTSISVNWGNIDQLERLIAGAVGRAQVLVIDYTGLGFGPAASIAANDESVWKKAERLKIFGAFDLQTMWTQEESEPELQPAVQFNYRLSPLVAACVKIALLRRHSNG